MTLIVTFVLGLLAGVIPKGIHIHFHKESVPVPPKKEEYNASMTDLLPNEVKEYYTTTNGMNKF